MTELFETRSKPIPITKEMVREAYRHVRSNKGSAGVDEEDLQKFEENLLPNLYKLWNRLASGSYFPKPVKEVIIPKSGGGERKLGIPTVTDRIAQQVIKAYLEPRLESEFMANSYGYRPHKNAHQAIEQVRQNTRQYAWVVDMDISKFFDEVDHELLMKSVERHVSEKWVKMYIRRWLETPISTKEGLVAKTGCGTPQGGVISPLLANLFLHYVLDKWIEKTFPTVAFVRYADDVIVHCISEQQSHYVLEGIKRRLAACKLRLNEEKTKIVYCQNYKRAIRKDYPKKFDFLGYSFKPMSKPSTKGGMFLGFDCEMSMKARSRIIEQWKEMDFHRDSSLTLHKLAAMLNVKTRGVISYYGKYNIWCIEKLLRHLDYRIAKWVKNKYKRMKESYQRAFDWLREIKASYPNLFYHWHFSKI